MNLTDFDYYLPEELIAQTPIEPRNASRLMVLNPNRKTIEHRKFFELKNFLRPNDCLIFNDTRVIPARLIGRKSTGARVEVFLLRRIDLKRWEVLVKPGRKIQLGTKIEFTDELSCEVIDRTDFGGRIIEFEFDGVFENILERAGEIPLPPYIHEKLDDSERYQTVYNRIEGSAAAPTAGLHFTTDQLEELKSLGIKFGFLTLHVGLGTFRPVNEERIEDHKMHSEFFSLPESVAELINETKKNRGRVIAVGTTSVRTLESVAQKFSGEIKPISGSTDIFIFPGYKFKIVDAMITNFHLPKSTLIMLVSAFAGREFLLDAYKTAVENRYRFFSFGDAMFIEERL